MEGNTLESCSSSCSCPIRQCTFQAPSINYILHHLRTVHSSDPRFLVTCGIDGCATTARKFSSLYSHIYRHHPQVVRKRKASVGSHSNAMIQDLQFGSNLFEDQDTSSADIQFLLGQDVEKIKKESALFLLKMKEHRRISQIAIDDIVENAKRLFYMTVERAGAGIRAKLAEVGVDPSSVDGLDTILKDVTDPFVGLETSHLQEKYYTENLGLIEPESVKLGQPEYTHQFTGSKRRFVEKWDTFQYVPLLSSLKQLLNDDSILEEIEHSHERIHSDSVFEDFCDGITFKKHPLFSKDPFALQVVAYYDELELCNPLGTHVKEHKLGIVFYSLANIHQRHRSQLKNINLAVVATVPVIEKHGLDEILKPFIADLNTLATTGVTVMIKGVPRTFKGALLTFLADNLGSNDLGGFKKSFSFSFRFCRTCLVTHDTLSDYFASDLYRNRDLNSHLSQIEEIEQDTTGHYSKTYGVNRRSCLLDISCFDMLNFGLAHDAMHDILEGLAPLEIKLLLMHYVSNSVFTLAEFNSRLLNFNFGYSECDKPIPILSQTLHNPKKSLRSSSSQMLLLTRILPFLIGDKIVEDDKHWHCFLLLRKILDIVLCQRVSLGMCSSLKLLIREHHQQFVDLYGADKYIPKMHFLLHYPEQIIALGPMCRTWTMRHEAKLNFFKQASRLANFKNIAYSLAYRHQRWICYEFGSSNILATSIECGPPSNGKKVSLVKEESKDIQESLIRAYPQLSEDSTVFRPAWVNKGGTLFQANNAFLITGSDGMDPKFSCLNETLVICGNIFFLVSVCNTIYFDSHYHAYVIEVTSQQVLVPSNDLIDFHVYHSCKLPDGLTYVSLKYRIV